VLPFQRSADFTRQSDKVFDGYNGCSNELRHKFTISNRFDKKRKEHMELLATVPLLIIDDLGVRKLGPTAAEELLEIVIRRYERASTLVTSNRPVEDWEKLLGDSAAVTAMLDRLLCHGHILNCGSRS
jgi:DNA replication protein DnaC